MTAGERQARVVEQPEEELVEGLLPGEDEDLTEDISERGLEMVRNRRRLISLLLAVVLMVVAIYVVLPKVAGLGDTLARIGDATWYCVPSAAALNALASTAYT